MLKGLKNWFGEHFNFLCFWRNKNSPETPETERSLIDLPTALREKLVTAIQNLPINPADQEAIFFALNETFERWRENPYHHHNSLVILSSPVTSVSEILAKTLQQWTEEKQVAIKLLPITARPDSIASIKSELEGYLQPKKGKKDSEIPEVVVIPNLSCCFLRSLEGLEGIEYIQSLLCNASDNRFWIIGTNQVGWEYLNCVYNLEAFCQEVLSLPTNSSQQLSEWLDPIIDQLEIIFDQPRLNKQSLDDDKDDRDKYFDRLASVSQGVSIVTIHSFLNSIRYQKADETEENQPQQGILVAENPKLPDVPTLEVADLYLLYSLFLHDDLTMSALAESLGDELLPVQVRVQVLRRKGVIETENEVIKINPIHYPKLKQQLASNNFIVGKR